MLFAVHSLQNFCFAIYKHLKRVAVSYSGGDHLNVQSGLNLFSMRSLLAGCKALFLCLDRKCEILEIREYFTRIDTFGDLKKLLTTAEIR